MLTIEVKEVNAGNGFKQFAVVVNGTELKRYWSIQGANDLKARCLQAWNSEKIGGKTFTMVG